MIDFAMENVLEHHLAGTVDLPANNPMSRRMCNDSLMVNIVNNSYRNHQIVFENMRNASQVATQPSAVISYRI